MLCGISSRSLSIFALTLIIHVPFTTLTTNYVDHKSKTIHLLNDSFTYSPKAGTHFKTDEKSLHCDALEGFLGNCSFLEAADLKNNVNTPCNVSVENC